jgi:hypothetical protein
VRRVRLLSWPWPPVWRAFAGLFVARAQGVIEKALDTEGKSVDGQQRLSFAAFPRSVHCFFASVFNGVGTTIVGAIVGHVENAIRGLVREFFVLVFCHPCCRRTFDRLDSFPYPAPPTMRTS